MLAIAIAAVLLVILLLLVAQNWVLKKEMRNMATAMQQKKETGSNRQLTVGSQNKQVVALANQINVLYRQMEESRIENKEALEEIRESMTNISHDLRTPLTSMMGYLSLLGKEGNTPEQQAHYLKVAQNKTAALHTLINALFEYARLEAGSYQFKLEKLDALDILTEQLALVYDDFTQQGQMPQVKLPNEPLVVAADREALERVFANLLQNALRHGDGDVVVEACNRAGKVQVVVSNKAKGLQLEEENDLFRRFFVADRVRSGQSTGLGLAIVKEFTEQMGGQITACYQAERLAFTLELPAAHKGNTEQSLQ